MGSVGLGNNANLGAFLNRSFPEGLDLGRCQITQALGVYVADPTSTFRAGMLVKRNSSGLVVPAAGDDCLGVAKWNHTLTCLAVATDETIIADTGVAVPLKHGVVTNARVASAALGAGTVYSGSTDYTLSPTNGTILALPPAGTITDGQTLYVTYTYQLSESELLTMQGKNFWNSMDEVAQNENRVTVITDAELLFTTQYDTSQNYALTGALSNLYTKSTIPGLFTSEVAGTTKFVGKVFQVPTAADPFLGLRLIKQPFAV